MTLRVRLGRDPLARTARRLLLAVVISLIALVSGAAGSAMAEAPSLKIASPHNGAAINDQTPHFEGTTTDKAAECPEPFPPEFDPVTVKLYAGTNTTSAEPVWMTKPECFLGETWRVGPVTPALAPGTYTVVAEQQKPLELEPAKSPPVTFSVVTTAPKVTLTYPANNSSFAGETQLVGGSAGTEQGDEHVVKVRLFSGSSVQSGSLLYVLTVPVVEGSFSAPFGGLHPGTYTAQAEQRDNAGNIGLSDAVTFTMSAPASPPPRPPVASFTWFPPVPKIGERVALASTSTDAASPIGAFRWDIAGTGAFQAAGPVISTSFSTPGNHVVRLGVTDGNGLSSVATETIAVAAQPFLLMQPFPIVRIVGTETSSGVNVALLTVQAPIATTVRVTCRGPGCRTRSQVRVAHTTARNRHASTAVLVFRRFQRALGAGAVLEIRVSKAGQIGKYTRFAIRRHKLPSRVDECITPIDPNPIACPA